MARMRETAPPSGQRCSALYEKKNLRASKYNLDE
jgi:hypothetical protein